MTGALVRRKEGTMRKAEPPKFTRWQKFKTALDAINHFKSPGTAVALEELRSGVGTPEERQPVRERLVRKGVFEAVETVALEKAENGPYRTAPVGTIDTVGELATLRKIAEQGILKRKERRDGIGNIGVAVGVVVADVVGAGVSAGVAVTIGTVAGVGAGVGAVAAGFVGTIVVFYGLYTRAEKLEQKETTQLETAMKKAQQLLTQ